MSKLTDEQDEVLRATRTDREKEAIKVILRFARAEEEVGFQARRGGRVSDTALNEERVAVKAVVKAIVGDFVSGAVIDSITKEIIEELS